MKKWNLEKRFRELSQNELPLIHSSKGESRLGQLFKVAREDLSLAKLAEAHWDATAILAEGGRKAQSNILYAVWASEIPGKPLEMKKNSNGWMISGTKMFCSGAGIVDRALITVGTEPILIDLNLRNCCSQRVQVNDAPWMTAAFKGTKTSTIIFNETPFTSSDIIGNAGWYLRRPGFWHGALGPAACWGGGAAGLVDYAFSHQRNDPHTLAHLAAMDANIWAIKSLLQTAAHEIVNDPHSSIIAQALALKTRHLIESLCTDILRRFARAYGPFPLAYEMNISKRYQELDLFLRQNHAERDLESLGKILKNNK